jgi:hypothetical protein
MSDNKNYKAEFEENITRFSWWERLQGSQFVSMISTFVGQMVYKSVAASDRNLQEAFLSTAVKRSSILAASEDKGYIGRKIMPSSGFVRATNLTNELLSLPRDTPLISKAALSYVLTNAVELPPLSFVDIPTSQLVLKVFKTVVTKEIKYLSMLLPKDITAQTHRVEVYVSALGGGAELWEKRYMFRRTDAKTKCYAEFYKPTEQLGIRFGSGVNGRIPPLNSEITLRVWTTSGDTTLINNQALEITGPLAYLNDRISITTLTPIVGGAKAESDEETRSGALYITPFDNQIVWDDDYAHYIKQNIANITWVVAWGEHEQEKQDGQPNVANINKIFVTAYSPVHDQPSLENIIVGLLNGTDYLNKSYQYKPASLKPFAINITGKAKGDKDLQQVKKAIKEMVSATYGLNPTKNRPVEILEKDVNTLIRNLNLLHDFSLSWVAFPSLIKLDDYIYIDMDASVVDIKYWEA